MYGTLNTKVNLDVKDGSFTNKHLETIKTVTIKSPKTTKV